MPISPMMNQYFAIKERYDENTIVMFRLGDFYEMFFDDAIKASKILDITLTGRDCGLPERAPMCGVPFHAVDKYVSVLLQNGLKVAICEQQDINGDAKIMNRDVSRIITAGTALNKDELLNELNNYLAVVYLADVDAAVAWTDISTGELYHEFLSAPLGAKLNELLLKINPVEIICNGKMLAESIELSAVKFGGVCKFSQYDDSAFFYDNALMEVEKQLDEKTVASLKSHSECVCATGALLSYIEFTQKRPLTYIKSSESFNRNDTLVIDAISQRTLELITSASGKKEGSLYNTLNKTKTKMGAITLQQWLIQPSTDEKEINSRLNAVELFVKDSLMRESFEDILSKIADINRLSARLSYGSITPRDCLTLGKSLAVLPTLKQLLSNVSCDYLAKLNNEIDALQSVSALIVKSIYDPLSEPEADDVKKKKNEQVRIFNSGYDSQLDEYRKLSLSSEELKLAMQQTERKITGIDSLKIGYNRVNGFFIEVPKNSGGDIPYRYVARQSTTNATRYVTPELKDLEEKILNAASLAESREIELYENLKTVLKDYVDKILINAKAIGRLDCICSLAAIAKQNRYCKPVINNDIKHIKISEGRHAVAEQLLGRNNYVPNDTYINDSDSSIMLITGPNMAGKSLYMRQTALIALLAHIGSYVPAKSAEISILDRIFTRVGASDDLASGRSTFMVEMTEVATILSNVTNNSLVILDEIGRGTATYDGLSIAWAVMEFLATKVHPKVLFSTHFHELTELEQTLVGVKNYKLTVKEVSGNIIFLRKLLRGSANKSFGIEVASLSGVDKSVLERAKEILKKLESADVARNAKMGIIQMSLFNKSNSNEIISILKDLDLDNVTPKMAFEILADLKEKVELDNN